MRSRRTTRVLGDEKTDVKAVKGDVGPILTFRAKFGGNGPGCMDRVAVGRRRLERKLERSAV